MKTIIVTALLFIAFSFSQNSNTLANNQDSVKTCIVSGEELSADVVTYVYFNNTVELCCDVCLKAFKKEPAKYLAGNLWCPVCQDDDGKKDISTAHDNVKYYFCNDGCKSTFESDPEKILSENKKDDE
ncbi:MAG TPA: hypothetical protein PK294_09425 [Ignavibacteria bacterium]|nr:hypothetical protein [Ignavibacteria bacterium]HQY52677.1 hypothetical protein [Ignavibacteria bacterium]HRB00642.1 hypothetical protein [Ignavibacteria bacterium]